MNTYIYIPVSYLKKFNISKIDFMQSSQESEVFLNKLLFSISKYAEIKNTLLIHDFFVLVLQSKTHIVFENEDIFNLFVSYIKNTNFSSDVFIDLNKKEISIKPDISPIFFNVLNEFVVN